MPFLIKKPSDIKPSEITDQKIYDQRRDFIKRMGLAATAAMGVGHLSLAEAKAYPNLAKSEFSTTTDKLTSLKDITSYNNFYEFGTGKSDPAKNAGDFNPKPWSVRVEGECEKPGDFHLEDLIKPHTLEERIYRFRCVEGWSMVIPWVGFPLADMIKQFKPTSKFTL